VLILFPIVFVFFFGLIFGSFNNVVIYRLPLGRSVVRPRSYCPACHHPIRGYDNIPVLSFLILNGKCRDCGARIPLRYPLVELLTGGLFTAVFLHDGLQAVLPFHLLFVSAMVVLAFIDVDHRLLPNVITLPGILVGFGSSFFNETLTWWNSLLSIFLFSGMLLGVAYLFKVIRGIEGLGMGDVKMIAMIGAFLGAQSTVFTILAGSILGLLAGLAVIFFKKENFQYKIPFGTFLAIAAVLALFFGPPVIHWYRNLFWAL
jgi:leader peptidase (prepilin peptidase)/N-methyltransferase